MIYNDFWAERRKFGEFHDALTQPIEIAALLVRVHPAPSTPGADVVLRRMVARPRNEHARVPILAHDVMDRGT